MKFSIRKRDRERVIWGLILIAPTLLFILIMNIWPILQTIYLSFTNAQSLGTPQWVGITNYLAMFKDPDIGRATLNTFIYAIVTVPIGTLLSLIVAVFLNQKLKGRSIFRTLYFIPVISAPAAVAMVWRWLYNSKFGLINYGLSLIGIHGPNWIGDSKYVLISIMIVGIWSGLGYNMIILLGGLQDVPMTYYEAAEMDGASKVRQFFTITIPLLSPTLFFVLTTSIISAMQIFDTIFMMVDQNNPALSNARSLVYLFYNDTFVNGNRGYGAAIAVFLLIIILILTAIQMRLQRKWVYYGGQD